MSQKGSFLFLGTGASMGTPVVTCPCAVCTSGDMRNRRLRPSGLLKIDDQRFLFDVGPDFREQALKYSLDQLTGVILTHSHYDHIAGLDDLRPFYFLQHQLLPCMLSRSTYEELKRRYAYFFEGNGDEVMGGPRFDFKVIDLEIEEHFFCSLLWKVVFYHQKEMQVTGYRLGNFAYIMDVKEYDDSIFHKLQGVEVLVLNGLRERPSQGHLTLDEAVDFARKVGSKNTWLSHVSHELDHVRTNERLPQGIQLAYDGLEVPIVC